MACICPDMAGSIYLLTGSIAPTPNVTNTLAIEYYPMHPMAMSITPTTMGTDLAVLDTLAVADCMAVSTFPSRQPTILGFNFTEPMHLNPSDFFPTSSDCLFNPDMLPGPYDGGSGVLPPRTFHLFDAMGSTTPPLLPPVHGDVGPTTTASTHPSIESTGRKQAHPQQVDGGLKCRKGSNHKGRPQAVLGQQAQGGHSSSAAASRQYGGPTKSIYGQISKTMTSNTLVGIPTTSQPSVSTIAPPTQFTPLPCPGRMSNRNYARLLQTQLAQQFPAILN